MSVATSNLYTMIEGFVMKPHILVWTVQLLKSQAKTNIVTLCETNIKTADFQREICAFHRQNIMSEDEL